MARKAHKSFSGGRSSAELLGVSSLFRHVPEGLAEKLFAKLNDAIYRPDQAITIEGAEGDKMFFFLTGSYSIQTGNDVQQDAQLRCRVFGEAALVGLTSSYPASARSTGFTLVQTLSRSDFKDAMREHPEEWDRFEALRLQVAGDGGHGRLRHRLKHNHFLSEAGADFLSACCRCAEDAFFAPGEVIVNRGDVLGLGQSPVYVLLCGEVEVLSEHNIHMLSLSPGEVFGEQGLREGCSPHETVLRNWKQGLSHCARLRADALEAAVHSFPACRDALEAMLKHRQAAAADFRERRAAWLQQTVAPALASSWVFADFPREAVERISEKGHIATPLDAERIPAGQNIVEAGQPADFMILLLRGDAEVLSKSSLVVGSICGGAMIGEACMLGLLAFRTATVRAATACHVVAVPSSVVQDVLGSPGFDGAREAFDSLRESRGAQVARAGRQGEIGSVYQFCRSLVLSSGSHHELADQVAAGLPMAALPVVLGDGWTSEARSFATAVALQAEHVHVPASGVWYTAVAQTQTFRHLKASRMKCDTSEGLLAGDWFRYRPSVQ
ncbi:unnamed protein product [Prorocentrum cordatum]|uniref:Cyclic nucleotide-binding domain-containing protein n=1 Tax=Prorocentrum cordatum TaxID=2364126 RepID=A0ABN9Q3D4_9DINO|nr:unnamed protein product [Polarella glacialis]